MRLYYAVLALLLGVGLFFTSPAWAFDVPPLAGQHIVDLTHTLDERQLSALNRQMEDVNQGSTVEIAVLVVPSLNGEAIEDVGFATAKTAWRLGKAGKDNGVLLLISTGDRRVRIEVGKGLEGELTDLQSNDIIRHRIGPELKQNHLFEGIQQGVTSITEAAAGHYVVRRVAGDGNAGGSGQRNQGNLPLPVLILLLFLFFGFWLWRRGGGGGYWGGGGWGGGGFGGGGGGGGGDGGGFTGGGGDFGGGGSSDSY